MSNLQVCIAFCFRITYYMHIYTSICSASVLHCSLMISSLHYITVPSATAFPVPPSSTVPPVVATSSTTAVPVQPSSTVPPGVITSAISSTSTVSSRFEERVTPTTTQTLRTTAATTSIPSSSVPSFSSTPAQPVSSTPVKLPSLSSVPVVSVVTTSFTPSRPSTSTLVVSSSTTTRNPIASSSPTGQIMCSNIT